MYIIHLCQVPDRYLRYETCSASWHRLMTTVRAWLYIHQVWNMLCQLSSSNDNSLSMGIYPLGIKHVPSVVIVACFLPQGYITMLWPLTWDDANWRSMFLTCGIYYHALTVVIRRWQLTERVSYVRGITMIWPLSWDDDKWRSMLHT